MRRGCLIAEFLIGFALASRPSEAQYGANFQTNTISGVTSNWSGDYCVGSNTFANALLIRNGGVLTNAAGYVGYLQTSSSNRVLVAGTNSVWNCANNLQLGVSGSGNSLVISNGGRVIDSSGFVGANPGSDSNSLLVVGANSIWTNTADVYVGTFGAGNSL
jgi:T5SS/PEP-CTERM-associated repeat protein